MIESCRSKLTNSHTGSSFFCDKCQIVPHRDNTVLNRDTFVLNRDTIVLNRDTIVLNCDNSAQLIVLNTSLNIIA